MVGELRRRRVPLIGRAAGWWSFLHIDDAARATAIAVEHSCAGIYNIVDDDPAPVSKWLPALARMLDAKRPFQVPVWLARLIAGDHVVTLMTQTRAGSNAKPKKSSDGGRSTVRGALVSRKLPRDCRVSRQGGPRIKIPARLRDRQTWMA
jgi:NAD dependent epimerase/dehydratase family enzyme